MSPTPSSNEQQFMATVSHELRGPLHAILGLSEILMNAELADGNDRIAEALYREATSMRVLVDDVVTYGQLSSDAPSLVDAPFAPRTLVTSIVDRLRAKADDAGLRLLVELDSAVPLRVLGDAVRFGQVVDNLVSNAIRYTSIGSVQVTLSADSETLTVTVRDTGAGIDAADYETIFEPFARVGDLGVGGTGLGLAVVKQIVDAMDGTIEVDSAVGVGSTFGFSIPCRPAVDETTDPNGKNESVQGTVLIVDDSEINRTLALKQLEIIGLSAVAVESGEGALELLATAPDIDLILMDWNLPGINGLETTSSIRSVGLVADSVPIIAMTANVLAGDRDACLEAGMNDHLGKPVALDDMRQMMHAWLSDDEAPQTPSVASEDTDASIRSSIERLVADLGDMDTVRIVIDTYLDELSSRTATLLDERPAKLDEARRAAHNLRSTSALLGADYLAELCLEFENMDEPTGAIRTRLTEEIGAVEALLTGMEELGVAS